VIVSGVRRNGGAGALAAVRVAIMIMVRRQRVECRLAGEG